MTFCFMNINLYKWKTKMKSTSEKIINIEKVQSLSKSDFRRKTIESIFRLSTIETEITFCFMNINLYKWKSKNKVDL